MWQSSGVPCWQSTSDSYVSPSSVSSIARHPHCFILALCSSASVLNTFLFDCVVFRTVQGRRRAHSSQISLRWGRCRVTYWYNRRCVAFSFASGPFVEVPSFTFLQVYIPTYLPIYLLDQDHSHLSAWDQECVWGYKLTPTWLRFFRNISVDVVGE